MGAKKEVKELVITEEVVEVPPEELEQNLRQAIAILIKMANM